MGFKSTLNDIIPEKSSAKIKATLKDEDGVVIPSATLQTLTLTLYDLITETIINSRDAVDALNANNVTLHATSGLLTYSMQPDDNQIIGTVSEEVHIILFQGIWSAGTRAVRHQIQVTVSNFLKVT